MADVEYVIYKRCVPGDRRKVEARSHDAPSGGGARDVRFPTEMFGSVLSKVFPEAHPAAGGEIHTAPVYWPEEGEVKGPITVEIWPPTKARSREMRLARVHEVVPFDEDHIPPAESDPFFFIWNDEERVWARYVTADDLRQSGWPPFLVDPILQSIETEPPDQNIRGWRNMRTEEGEHRSGR
jgi:hypothetical protein